MKKLSLLLCLLAGLWACNEASSGEKEAAQQDTKQETSAANDTGDSQEALPVITFEETEYDFGTIKEGDVVEHVFKFKNTGNAPLVIQNATAPCGCTVPTWTKEPIPPGGNGEIVVQFNSKGKVGQQTKQVTITANTKPEISQVTIKTFVEGTGNTVIDVQGPRKK
ncbi:hypothetical protein FHS56_001136 [Thermonema lapsum]|jgi:hypothetical protein|uniref:DUF1573 domain-containing protein n=1 Tax=Thermonema lapsum TaxID=28195 RepID=A0A846MPX8_9BACT|nr:DUF1573 domain-containing protein [Thermonema lapsum]NIK73623.1 hypothetical protein [Thermonema lapsum]